jgi:membrane fusion protein, heavy metal efflux system
MRLARQDLLLAGGGGLLIGILLTLLFANGRSRSPLPEDETASRAAGGEMKGQVAGVSPLRRSVGAFGVLLFATGWQPASAVAADASPAPLTSVPSTMATDLAQRAPDGTLFVPKATQHLLSIRTILTSEAEAPLATEVTGTIIAGPANFGRVQPGRPGRIEAAPGGLAYVGKRVRKGELLAYVQTYIEAADRANLGSTIAETEARIEKNRTILSRYENSPGSVPQVRVDEVRGELQALERRLAELSPSVARREPIVAPISGVVSLAQTTIGQIVEARDVLFEIIDPSDLWIEAVSFEPGIGHEFTEAVAVTRSGERIPLTFMGRGAALRQQATVLTFKMQANPNQLAVGAPVRVVLQSSTKINGFVIPASAVVRGETGLPIVWIKTDAERFEPQLVKLTPLDGQNVVVTAGLKVDRRVVTDGVTLLNQVR